MTWGALLAVAVLLAAYAVWVRTHRPRRSARARLADAFYALEAQRLAVAKIHLTRADLKEMTEGAVFEEVNALAGKVKTIWGAEVVIQWWGEPWAEPYSKQ